MFCGGAGFFRVAAFGGATSVDALSDGSSENAIASGLCGCCVRTGLDCSNAAVSSLGFARPARDVAERAMHRHVEPDRRVGIGLARLEQRTHDAAVFPARIEQNLRARGRVHGNILSGIHLRRGGHRQAAQQRNAKNSQSHQAVHLICAATIAIEIAGLNIA